MPDAIGMYLALTGRSIGRADAYRLGLATHCIPAGRFGEIRAGLADADTVDPLLDDRHEDPGPGELEPLRAVIARCFSARYCGGHRRPRCGPSGALRRLGAGRLSDLAARSPTSLKITHRHVHLAARSTCAQP